MKLYARTAAQPADEGSPVQRTYFNTEQVAFRTGLSASYFEKARVRGDGPPFIKIGSRVLYSSDRVDGWLNERTARSTSDPIACNDNFLSKLREARHA